MVSRNSVRDSFIFVVDPSLSIDESNADSSSILASVSLLDKYKNRLNTKYRHTCDRDSCCTVRRWMECFHPCRAAIPKQAV